MDKKTGKVVKTPTDPFGAFETDVDEKKASKSAAENKAAAKRNNKTIMTLVAEKRIAQQELDRCKNNMDKKLQ